MATGVGTIRLTGINDVGQAVTAAENAVKRLTITTDGLTKASISLKVAKVELINKFIKEFNASKNLTDIQKTNVKLSFSLDEKTKAQIANERKLTETLNLKTQAEKNSLESRKRLLIEASKTVPGLTDPTGKITDPKIRSAIYTPISGTDPELQKRTNIRLKEAEAVVRARVEQEKKIQTDLKEKESIEKLNLAIKESSKNYDYQRNAQRKNIEETLKNITSTNSLVQAKKKSAEQALVEHDAHIKNRDAIVANAGGVDNLTAKQRTQIGVEERAAKSSMAVANQASKTGLSIQTMGAKIKSATSEFTWMIYRHVQWLATGAVLYGTFGLIKNAISQVINEQEKLIRIQANLQASDAQMAQAKTGLIGLSLKYGRSLADLAHAQYLMNTAGIGLVKGQLDIKSSMETLETAIKLARIGFDDVGEVVKSLGYTLNQFGLQADQAGNVADMLAMSVATTATELTDLRESLKYVGPVAHNAGLSVAETLAIFGAFADVNIRGSKAGEALRQMLTRLQVATKQAKAEMDKINASLGYEAIRIYDTAGNFRGLFAVLQDVKSIYPVLNDEQKAHLAYYMAGLRSLPAFTQLLDELTTGFQDQLKAIEGANGALDKINATMETAASQKIKKMIEAWNTFKRSFATLALPPLSEYIDSLLESLEQLRADKKRGESEGKKGITTDELIRKYEDISRRVEKGAIWADMWGTRPKTALDALAKEIALRSDNIFLLDKQRTLQDQLAYKQKEFKNIYIDSLKKPALDTIQNLQEQLSIVNKLINALKEMGIFPKLEVSEKANRATGLKTAFGGETAKSVEETAKAVETLYKSSAKTAKSFSDIQKQRFDIGDISSFKALEDSAEKYYETQKAHLDDLYSQEQANIDKLARLKSNLIKFEATPGSEEQAKQTLAGIKKVEKAQVETSKKIKEAKEAGLDHDKRYSDQSTKIYIDSYQKQLEAFKEFEQEKLKIQSAKTIPELLSTMQSYYEKVKKQEQSLVEDIKKLENEKTIAKEKQQSPENIGAQKKAIREVYEYTIQNDTKLIAEKIGLQQKYNKQSLDATKLAEKQRAKIIADETKNITDKMFDRWIEVEAMKLELAGKMKQAETLKAEAEAYKQYQTDVEMFGKAEAEKMAIVGLNYAKKDQMAKQSKEEKEIKEEQKKGIFRLWIGGDKKTEIPKRFEKTSPPPDFDTPTIFNGIKGMWRNKPTTFQGHIVYPFVLENGESFLYAPGSKLTDWMTLPKEQKIHEVDEIYKGFQGTSKGDAWETKLINAIRSTPKEYSPEQRMRAFEEYLAKTGTKVMKGESWITNEGKDTRSPAPPIKGLSQSEMEKRAIELGYGSPKGTPSVLDPYTERRKQFEKEQAGNIQRQLDKEMKADKQLQDLLKKMEDSNTTQKSSTIALEGFSKATYEYAKEIKGYFEKGTTINVTFDGKNVSTGTSKPGTITNIDINDLMDKMGKAAYEKSRAKGGGF